MLVPGHELAEQLEVDGLGIGHQILLADIRTAYRDHHGNRPGQGCAPSLGSLPSCSELDDKATLTGSFSANPKFPVEMQ